MSFLDVTIKTSRHECRAKVEDRPELMMATKDGLPVRHFWVDLSVVIPEGDLEKLRVPRSEFLDDFVLEHKGERWKITDPVAYNFNKSPVGNFVVFQVNFEKCEYLPNGSRFDPSMN